MQPQIVIFLPPNLTVFLVNFGSMWVPTGLLHYVRRLGCISVDDSSGKINQPPATFHCPSLLQAVGLGKHNTFCCLLFTVCLWALIQPRRPLRERIWQTVLVDTRVSGDQFSCSPVAVEKELDCQSNKQSWTVVLQGLPDQGPVSESTFIENPELVNPEMKGNSGFSVSQSQFTVTLSQLPEQFHFAHKSLWH